MRGCPTPIIIKNSTARKIDLRKYFFMRNPPRTVMFGSEVKNRGTIDPKKGASQ